MRQKFSWVPRAGQHSRLRGSAASPITRRPLCSAPPSRPHPDFGRLWGPPPLTSALCEGRLWCVCIVIICGTADGTGTGTGTGGAACHRRGGPRGQGHPLCKPTAARSGAVVTDTTARGTLHLAASSRSSPESSLKTLAGNARPPPLRPRPSRPAATSGLPERRRPLMTSPRAATPC